MSIHSSQEWVCTRRETVSGRLYYGRAHYMNSTGETVSGRLYYGRAHYMNSTGETACGRAIDRRTTDIENEADAPPGTPRCKRCESRWFAR